MTIEQSTERPVRRSRRGRANQTRTQRDSDYSKLTSNLPLASAYSEDQIATIHASALKVLKEVGVRVLHPEARTYMADAGATVRDLQVHFPKELVDQAIASAPSRFTITSAGGTVDIGGRNTFFLPVGGPPHAMDTARGKRPGTFDDFRNFVRLTQSFDVLQMTGPSVEPQDIAPKLRHLEMMRTYTCESDKPVFVYSRGQQQVEDSFEILRRRLSLSDEEFRARPHCFTVINTNSPLTLDLPMCQGILDFSGSGQICIITPFTLSGAMAPVTIPGALVQQHAEMLSALVLTQLVRPGAPVIYGGFTSNVDMKTGAPAFGTPEYVRACWGTGQLARLLELPWRSSASCASNTPDAQAIWETQMALWGALTGGANLVLHAAGWLEGGLSASYEKFILDIEQLQHMAELMQPVVWTEDDLALDAIREVGSGGHFFGARHTMSRFETAFYAPMVSDWSNYGEWQDRGSKTATERAHEIWQQRLAEFVPPPVAPDIRQSVNEFVERRIAEGGAEPVS